MKKTVQSKRLCPENYTEYRTLSRRLHRGSYYVKKTAQIRRLHRVMYNVKETAQFMVLCTEGCTE